MTKTTDQNPTELTTKEQTHKQTNKQTELITKEQTPKNRTEIRRGGRVMNSSARERTFLDSSSSQLNIRDNLHVFPWWTWPRALFIMICSPFSVALFPTLICLLVVQSRWSPCCSPPCFVLRCDFFPDCPLYWFRVFTVFIWRNSLSLFALYIIIYLLVINCFWCGSLYDSFGICQQ